MDVNYILSKSAARLKLKIAILASKVKDYN